MDTKEAVKRYWRRAAAVGALYGCAFGVFEVGRLFWGHGSQMPPLRSVAVAAATVAGDVAVFLAAALAVGLALFLAQRFSAFARRNAGVLLELSLWYLYLAPTVLLAAREHFLVGLARGAPLKVALYGAAAAAALLLAGAAYLIKRLVFRGWARVAAAVGAGVVLAVLFVRPMVLAAARPSFNGPDVVVISLDTVRCDHLGCYGYDLDTSPNVDAFARGAILYENAICVQPTTNPSHTSMFTGLYPEEHGVTSNFVPLRERCGLLAEILSENGYDAAAIIGGFPLDRRLSNLGRGFLIYDDYICGWSYFRHTLAYRISAVFYKKIYGDHRPAPVVTAEALKQLRRERSRPLFLFVHYFDPHAPYLYHGRAERFFRGADRPDFPTRWREFNWLWHRYKAGTEPPPCTPAVVALYDGEILYTDRAVGELFNCLEAGSGRTLVILTSDHGESFGEHRKKYHGNAVFDTETAVVLMLKLPSGRGNFGGGLRVKQQVEILSIANTALKFAGVPTARYDGKKSDLLSFDEGDAAGKIFGFSQTGRKCDVAAGVVKSREYAVRAADFKIIYDVELGEYRLYDVAEDPGETEDLAAELRSGRYAAALAALRSHVLRGKRGEGAATVKGDLAERLRSLGYTN
jgi:choline-sulfatase